ncbi:MAG: hypothetical protein ACRDHL_07885 [Candidatus Promineifilaceae bacterium]
MSEIPEEQRLLAAGQAARPGRLEGLAGRPAAAATGLQRVNFAKIGLFGVSLFLFIMAITLMKDGAVALTPLIRDVLRVDNPVNSLGFGWLFAYVVMSGSPVAASALTFFVAGAISDLGAFAMIAGSRLGGGFIVLMIGFLYVLRGRSRATSLGMGLLSLTVTGCVYLLGLPLGALLLGTGALDGVQLGRGALLTSVTEAVFAPISAAANAYLPEWAMFLLGLGVILISFKLFDQCLPEMTIKTSQFGRVSRLVYRPGVMFILGALVTLISMSVSISLSILVPLSNRGFVRRENVIPYILGAGITTFIDTLLAAVLLGNPRAFTVVLVEMITIGLVSLALLTVAFDPFQRWMLRLVSWITARRRNTAAFMAAIFVVPILLLLV